MKIISSSEQNQQSPRYELRNCVKLCIILPKEVSPSFVFLGSRSQQLPFAPFQNASLMVHWHERRRWEFIKKSKILFSWSSSCFLSFFCQRRVFFLILLKSFYSQFPPQVITRAQFKMRISIERPGLTIPKSSIRIYVETCFLC